MRKALRKIAATAALLALLAPGVSTLAETLSASDLPACCNTIYCPVHHRQMRDLQKDKADCGAMAASGQNGCSLRACDAAPNLAAGISVFVLTVPVALRSPVLAEGALPLAARNFFSLPAVPLVPPPRTLPS